jgi:glucokinase
MTTTTPAHRQALVVADIGGTNARFALATPDKGAFRLAHITSYACHTAQSLGELLDRYLIELGDAGPECACLAIAGPNDGRTGIVTNLGWQVDADAMAQSLGLSHVQLANDFAALASAAPGLGEDGALLLKPGTPRADGPISVLGPGTGLGVALVVPHGGGFTTVSTEGGHMGFAPVTPAEIALCAHLRKQLPHVSIESLLCGAGLTRIHGFVSGSAGLPASEVSARALAGTDAHCREAVRMFIAILGSVAGDVALVHGATGGVMIGGGIVPRLLPLLAGSAFCERFLAKEPMRALLEKMPVRLITAEHVALHGAAALYWQLRA